MKKIIILFSILITLNAFAHPKYHRNNKIIQNGYIEKIRADSLHGFDVLKYDLSINIDDQNQYISGTVVTQIIAEEDLTEIEFELVGLDVDSALLNGNITDYIHQNGIITIDLGLISSGEQFETTVVYSGNPILCTNPYALGMFFSTGGVFTISDPNASRYWWPCYDHPWDKAEVDLHITIRDDWLVGCNGIRANIHDNFDGTKTHHWLGENPMATYLVSVTAKNFVELNDEYNGIPIQNFVPPAMQSNAEEDFSGLPEMLAIYSEKYGDYPFEKYGNTVTNFSTYGAMEHQTMTTLDNFIITGNHTYDTIIAHELAHQWFGNCLTPLTWKDVWLSEGFAVYSEAVFIEGTYGYEAMLNYVQNDIQSYYLSWSGGANYTIYDPAYNSIFTPVTYEKAASILHMIRLMVGTEQFFEILQTYFTTFYNGNVITEDFKNVCEEVSSLELDQFFQQWIFDPGIPTIEYTYFIKNENEPEILTFAKTNSTSGTDFHITLPIYVNYESSYDSLQVYATPNEVTETILSISDSNIVNVEFDRDNWIMNRGYIEKTLEISQIFAGNNSNSLAWNEFWEEVSIDGYNIFRTDELDGEFQKINESVIAENYYLDEDVTNGITYYYKISAVIYGNFETILSPMMEATPIDFPFDQGILVIDETKDGNGVPGNPTDVMVDEFYQNTIEIAMTQYDYYEMGELTLEDVRNYSTIIWHDDDVSQHYITDNLSILGSYILAGGNLLISGWKTAAEIPADFAEFYLNLNEQNIVTEWSFTGAISDNYNDLNIDPDKVSPAFNGTLPYICTFEEHENPIYNFHAESGSDHEGEQVAIRNGDVILLGFPLYYCFENEVSEFLHDILVEFDEITHQNEQIVSSKFDCSAYPNPFYTSGNSRGSELTISFSLSTKNINDTKIEIYNLKGQKVKTFPNLQINKSPNLQIIWDGKDERENPVSSGIYFYRLKSGSQEEIKKILIFK
ncbi:MAG: T9SS type A sorting domain-containing protein [Candidatus Cloacimonetes bacterium]|nr:T9SS type A sorting domain-containing protein [Candidatus Cloacimonadota bacterium]